MALKDGLDLSLMALTLKMLVSIATMAMCLKLKTSCAAVLRRMTPAHFSWSVSLVNPHDIVFWPAWSMWKRSLLDLEGIGEDRCGTE